MFPLTPTLVLLLATGAMASTAREWVKYKLKHEKLYSEEEDTARMKIWMKNVAMVEKHNSENHNYTMGINKFSDWTKEEFNNLLGYRPTGERSNGKTFENVKTPNKVDFRQKDLVTSVKNQWNCDSSWAFSAVGAIEGVWAKNTGKLVSLSVQQLLDCRTDKMFPCSGGSDTYGWGLVIQFGGIQSKESYPYTGGNDGLCNVDSSKFVAHISGYQDINPDEDQIMSALVELGHPISISVYVDETWTYYTGGIYDKYQEWNGPLNYDVLIVGYDKSGPEPFWIVKNSWGTDWGENGYIRIKMGVNSCGLKNFPCYPTIDTISSSTSTITSSTSSISSSTSTTTASTSSISSSTSTTTASTSSTSSSTLTNTASTSSISSSPSTTTASTSSISSSTLTTTASTSSISSSTSTTTASTSSFSLLVH